MSVPNVQDFNLAQAVVSDVVPSCRLRVRRPGSKVSQRMADSCRFYDPERKKLLCPAANKKGQRLPVADTFVR